MKYLDSVGLTYLWGIITNLFTTKEEVDALLDTKANSADLATVATTGDYSDLSGKPQVVYTTIEAYNNMSSHNANTLYYILEDD